MPRLAPACGPSRDDITRHTNPDFRIRVIDGASAFETAFALDIVGRLKAARDDGRAITIIFPVGPVGQFRIAAEVINTLRLPLDHLHSFNMDEYADQDGNTAPADWPGSFQYTMWREFYSRLDEALRPPEGQIHFPTSDKIDSYAERIADRGGADVCYGGIGWTGHIAFWEPHMADRYPDFEEWQAQGAQMVDLNPSTIYQNALHSFGGDWSRVPPKAATIAPKEILGAKHRSFWLDGAFGGGVTWQGFIARLVAHGPVSPYVPGSILQTARTDYTILDTVAADVGIQMR